MQAKLTDPILRVTELLCLSFFVFFFCFLFFFCSLRKLAYRWIRILFRVWRTRTPFDQNRYIQSLLAKTPEIRSFLQPQKPEKIAQAA